MTFLAIELASTLRHDGDGGVTDDLATCERATRWLSGQAEVLARSGVGTRVVDEALRNELVALRQAVRALFAKAVSPAPPSRADAHHLPAGDEALGCLNAAAARQPVAPRLVWPEGASPSVRRSPGSGEADLVATLAHDAIEFLASPERDRLRACSAPRCVRYFVQRHGRQQWCKPTCGNRARVARHYRRTRTEHARQDVGTKTPAEDRGRP